MAYKFPAATELLSLSSFQTALVPLSHKLVEAKSRDV